MCLHRLDEELPTQLRSIRTSTLQRTLTSWHRWMLARPGAGGLTAMRLWLPYPTTVQHIIMTNLAVLHTRPDQ